MKTEASRRRPDPSALEPCQAGTFVAIEIRSFDQPTEELSEFVVSTWLASYRGKMSVPRWSARYFDWQFAGADNAREYVISAWSDGRLVGALVGLPFPLLWEGEEHLGVHGSWLSVDREFRREGVASKLAQRMNEVQQERGCVGRLGYAFQGARVSLGPRFWKKSQPDTHLVRPMRLWARIINPRKVSRWSNKRFEQILLSGIPKATCAIGKPDSSVNVRSYTEADRPACARLINAQASQADLAALWTDQRLDAHLSYPDVAKTLVVERDGNVVGFISYHFLPLVLQGEVESAVIDLLSTEELTSKETRSLLNTALRSMQDEQVDLVLMREFAGQPNAELLRTRFVPQLAESLLLFSATDQPPSPPRKLRKVHVLWR
ncbi:GNAT family N-acetyltransferase [Rubinisphaera brasiliensis]|uniref:N-acetyltransferase domain-containing protein n=1 Tax=Rubinisphaera brasiliensis (strain ATCC 49424 / DSM 5305 / JCM 21570 / IAM 15109 / NBRC 103401 / IFAM 1448) TaxID=756272 RepID=F0SHK4_RUBBR|nr:GNAT family N-acetyltransferase [Rubinisphaera brasiliensis]ADY58442.1 hypothetical protein Plabr_0819 [Rubinisphaera brasiliensis DSM 5305]